MGEEGKTRNLVWQLADRVGPVLTAAEPLRECASWMASSIV